MVSQNTGSQEGSMRANANQTLTSAKQSHKNEGLKSSLPFILDISSVGVSGAFFAYMRLRWHSRIVIDYFFHQTRFRGTEAEKKSFDSLVAGFESSLDNRDWGWRAIMLQELKLSEVNRKRAISLHLRKVLGEYFLNCCLMNNASIS